jgi:hypothetical protein
MRLDVLETEILQSIWLCSSFEDLSSLCGPVKTRRKNTTGCQPVAGRAVTQLVANIEAAQLHRWNRLAACSTSIIHVR